MHIIYMHKSFLHNTEYDYTYKYYTIHIMYTFSEFGDNDSCDDIGHNHNDNGNDDDRDNYTDNCDSYNDIDDNNDEIDGDDND